MTNVLIPENPIPKAMLSIGWNEIIVGVITTLVVAILCWCYKKCLEWKDSKKIYEWLKNNSSDMPGNKFRSTCAISAGVKVSEDRVNALCSTHSKIRKSTGEKPDMWTIYDGPARSVYEERGLLKI